MSLHRPDWLEGFDRVVGLRHGELVFDRPPRRCRPRIWSSSIHESRWPLLLPALVLLPLLALCQRRGMAAALI